MDTFERVALIEAIERFVSVCDNAQTLLKVREDRAILSRKVARLEQGLAGLREKWAISSAGSL